jgi:hypothetical protein
MNSSPKFDYFSISTCQWVLIPLWHPRPSSLPTQSTRLLGAEDRPPLLTWVLLPVRTTEEEVQDLT